LVVRGWQSLLEVLPKLGRNMEEEVCQDFSVILVATLTLLGLIIGFSFSMAISRYDHEAFLTEMCAASFRPNTLLD